ncbi:MAG: type II secretion system protein [Bilophila wadsworthia]
MDAMFPFRSTHEPLHPWMLIALAILSTVALLRSASADSLTQLAETDGGRRTRAGRGKMIQMLRESPDSLDQWGTLSPEYPDVEWHSKLIALRCMEGKRLEFRLVENRGTSSRELLLEYILPR